MLDRRRNPRSRVCLEGALTCGLESPILRVRLRNLSASGAQIVVPGGHLASTAIEVDLPRGQDVRRAQVVWRRMDRFGVAFDAPPRET